MELYDKETTIEKTKELTPLIVEKHGEEIGNYFRHGYFWHVLNVLTPYDDSDMITLLSSQALTKAIPNTGPGHYRGHKILYEQLIEKNNYDVSDEFKKRLFTGSFWEALSESSNTSFYEVIHRTLDTPSDFDTSFDGREILKQNTVFGNIYFRLRLFSPCEEQLDAYVDLMSQYKYFEPGLLIPYFSSVLDSSSVYDGLRFSELYLKENDEMREEWSVPEGLVSENDLVKETYAQKLSVPFMQLSINSDLSLQKKLADCFDTAARPDNIYFSPRELAEPLLDVYPFLNGLSNEYT